MNTTGRCLASLVIVLAVAGCGGTTISPATGTISGTVSSSLGAVVGATVVVTPSGAAALPATTTSATGAYSVSNVPVGGGTVTVSNVPAGCTAPQPVAYSAVTSAATLKVNVPILCVGTGTLTGTISSSLGGPLVGVTVTATPQGHAALTGVTTNGSGVYSVTNVPAGSGSISVSNVGGSCTAPAATAYASLTNGGTVTTNITVTCTPVSPPPATNLSVGQSAVFTDSAHMNTALTLQSGGEYLIAVVNTDSSSSALEDFTLHGVTTVSASVVAHAAPHGVRSAHTSRAAAPKIPMTPISPEIARAVALRARTERAHMAWIDRWPAMAAQARASRPMSIRKSTLAGTTVGQVNRVWVANFSGGSCNSVDTVWARTVYVGTHVIVLADTNTTTWPLANRPDTSFYAQFGGEWDAVTYPHLQNYFGDPMVRDAALSGVGKVTVVFTPQVNADGVAGFVNSCDLFTPSTNNQFTNATEMIYAWVANPAAGDPVSFWERDWRGTAAHEGKHVVSLATHIANNTGLYEQSWLEEAMAQESAEIWERHFNTATWKGNAGFGQTIACEYEPASACYSATNPIVLSDRHFPFYFGDLSAESANADSGGFATSVYGKYGTGWAFIRWATDQYSGGSPEPTMLKALVSDATHNGLANVSAHTGASISEMLVYWSLASAFDATTLADSATFIPTDIRATMPSFDFRNIFSMGHSGGSYIYFPAAYPVSTHGVSPGAFDVTISGVPGTGTQYCSLSGVAAAGSETLELRSGAGGQISSSSGLRAGIIRIQ